ncbi:putative EAP30 Vps36 family [Trypanosoma vivax]|uniref:Vacuolar protein-sorting-associated protein 36 n=1 Tax=Trypanosoma vivax (strain Y486) TaxID=1055687 RepID=G0U4S6_TRYVY|nr:hypothetical protein TRVL_02740 [Trypanosoma vivax]KAH8611212.1 putative EAP30 Vps36 family [Trypanosoma vivax]CCC52441.1 conserved hypothetical protein [Trypanosoma vivax Y486]
MVVWEHYSRDKFLHLKGVTLCEQDGVELLQDGGHPRRGSGTLILSASNIFFVPNGDGGAVLRIPLDAIAIDSMLGGPLVGTGSDLPNAKLVVPLGAGGKVQFSFVRGGLALFVEILSDVLQQWNIIRQPVPGAHYPQSTATPSHSSQTLRSDSATSAIPNASGCSGGEHVRVSSDDLFSVTDRAGIAGLMRVSAETVQQREAFRDIDHVMKNVSSLVAAIRHLRQKQQSAAGMVPSEDTTAIESIEATLGLSATARPQDPIGFVVGDTHSKFHQELAREIHLWITHEKNQNIFGTMPLIPLIELFSLYNKARGGHDLVSTNDVLCACRVLDKQAYAEHTLKKLSSGRLALQRKDSSVVLEKLERVLGPRLCNSSQAREPGGGVSFFSCRVPKAFPVSPSELKSINEVEFASVLNVAYSVAMDLLEELEAQGFLCRSGGEFGCLVFHWNIFVF